MSERALPGLDDVRAALRAESGAPAPSSLDAPEPNAAPPTNKAAAPSAEPPASAQEPAEAGADLSVADMDAPSVWEDRRVEDEPAPTGLMGRLRGLFGKKV